MPRYEASIVIARPVSRVFAYMDDITREHEWQPHLVEAEQIPDGPTTVGTLKRYVSEFMGKKLRNTYVVQAYEPDRRVVCESTEDSVLSATTEIRWENAGGATRVTMSMDGSASGPLRLVPARVLEKKFAQEVDGALERLKLRLEGAAGEC